MEIIHVFHNSSSATPLNFSLDDACGGTGTFPTCSESSLSHVYCFIFRTLDN